MNGFERILKALAGEWSDKRPVVLHNFMMAAKEARFSMKEFRDDPKRRMCYTTRHTFRNHNRND